MKVLRNLVKIGILVVLLAGLTLGLTLFFNLEQGSSSITKNKKEEAPDKAWEQNYLMTMDPELGRPTPEKLEPVLQRIEQERRKAKVPGEQSHPWVERGPNNVDGRTNTIMYDPNDSSHEKVWAGGVTGDLWYNHSSPSSQVYR